MIRAFPAVLASLFPGGAKLGARLIEGGRWRRGTCVVD